MSDAISIARKRLNSIEGMPSSVEVLEQNIIEFYKGGKSQKEIATLYGTTQGYVSKVLKKYQVPVRKRWDNG